MVDDPRNDGPRGDEPGPDGVSSEDVAPAGHEGDPADEHAADESGSEDAGVGGTEWLLSQLSGGRVQEPRSGRRRAGVPPVEGAGSGRDDADAAAAGAEAADAPPVRPRGRWSWETGSVEGIEEAEDAGANAAAEAAASAMDAAPVPSGTEPVADGLAGGTGEAGAQEQDAGHELFGGAEWDGGGESARGAGSDRGGEPDGAAEPDGTGARADGHEELPARQLAFDEAIAADAENSGTAFRWNLSLDDDADAAAGDAPAQGQQAAAEAGDVAVPVPPAAGPGPVASAAAVPTSAVPSEPEPAPWDMFGDPDQPEERVDATRVFPVPAAQPPHSAQTDTPAPAIPSFALEDDDDAEALPPLPPPPAPDPEHPRPHDAGTAAHGRSRGPRTGLIVLWSIVGALAVIVLIVLFALGARLSAGAASAPSPTPTATAPKTASPTPTVIAAGPQPPGVHEWNTLRGGECLQPFSGPWAQKFTVVDCSSPHAAQLVYVGSMSTDPAAPFPGADQVGAQINTLCTKPGILNLDAANALNDAQLQGAYPVTPGQWNSGQRDYYCFVSRSSGQPITGSLVGSGPTG